MYRIAFLAAVMITAVVFLTVGCGGPQSVSWDTFKTNNYDVATADSGYVLPASDLYEMMYFSHVAAAGGPVSDSTIAAFRDSIIVDSLIGYDANNFDLESHYYYWKEFQDQYYKLMRKVFWDSTVVINVKIDSQDVADFYEAHKDKYEVPEEVLVYHILASPIGFAQNSDSVNVRGWSRRQLWREAELYAWRMHRLLDYGEAFENVAYLYSHDQMTKDRGGRLGWVVRGTYVEPFDSVAFSLEPGTYSQPYSDGDGFHILYVKGHTEAGPLPIDSPQVITKVTQGVFDEKSAAMAGAILDSLRKIADIKINPAVVDTNIYYVEDSTWAAVVNGTDTVDARILKGLEENYRRALNVDSTDHETRLQMIDQAVGPLLVVQAARRRGIDTLRAMVAERNRLRRGTARKVLLADLYTPEYTPPDSDIAHYYKDHYAEFNPTHHLEVEELVTTSADLAQYLREQEGTGMTMKEQADYYRDEGYQISYAYLGVLDKATTDSTLYAAAEATAANHVTRPVEKDGQYHVMRVIARQYAKPLAMARNEIKAALLERYARQFWSSKRDEYFRRYHVRLLRDLPPFELPRLADRNHPRTLPAPRYGG